MTPPKIAIFLAALPICAHGLIIDKAELDKRLKAAVLEADIAIEQVETLSDNTYHAVRWSKARITKIHRFNDDGFSIPEIGDQVLIETPGGEVQGVGSLFSGFARPLTQHQYRAHLTRNSNDKYFVTGFEFGLTPRVSHRAYSRNRTDGSNGQGDGAFLYWKPGFFPIPYFISSPSFLDHPEYIPALDEAFSTWSAPNDVKVQFLAMGCSNTTRHENDGMNNVILLKDYWPYDPAAVAITRNFYVASAGDESGMILDSDILLNGVYHNFSEAGAAERHDIQNILTHEVGHFLGLGHETAPEDTNATMYGSAETGETKKRTLEIGDLAGVHEAYTGASDRVSVTGTRCQLLQTPSGCSGVHHGETPLSEKLGFFFPFLLALPFLLLRRVFLDT